jgi:hypothetical protein
MSAFEIEVDTNLAEFNHWVAQTTSKQLAFAEALSITRLAQAAQRKVIGDLPRHFIIRSPWLAKGIRTRPADKRDFPIIEGAVGTKDEFMELQEVGGIRRPRSRAASGPPPILRKTARSRPGPVVPASLALPGAAPGAVRSSINVPIPLPNRPARVLRKPAVFIAKLKKGPSAGSFAILRRADPTGRYPLQVLYIFRPETRIARRFHFTETVQALVAREYGPIFVEALQRAIEPKVKAKSS